MVQYRVTSKDDIELLMQSRLEMLREVNHLPADYIFDEELVEKSREYFQNANQTTVLTIDKSVIGCASLCYVDMMPTFSHPTGKRAHLMNVYTNQQYRRQGIAAQMLSMLIDEAREKGVTEISLESTECMVLNLN